MAADRLPHEKGFHISWDQIHRDSRALAWRLDGQGPDNGAWRAVVAITRGGMAPAMIAARELDIRTVDTISVKSYDHQDQSEAQREHRSRSPVSRTRGSRLRITAPAISDASISDGSTRHFPVSSVDSVSKSRTIAPNRRA